MTDPGSRLPTRESHVDPVIDADARHFWRMLPERDPGQYPAQEGPLQPVRVLSAETRGDLARDRGWREMFGPAGVGDHIGMPLVTGGTCWARLNIARDSSGGFFSDDDAEFVAGVAPMLAARIRDGLRTPAPRDDPAPEPGTIILDEKLSPVSATQAAWEWLGRLGLRRPNDAEPPPHFVYAAAAQVAIAQARETESSSSARVRLQAADGRWVVGRVAPLTHGIVGYAVTLEAARSEDLAPLLMRAWSLTVREREEPPRERQVCMYVDAGPLFCVTWNA